MARVAVLEELARASDPKKALIDKVGDLLTKPTKGMGFCLSNIDEMKPVFFKREMVAIAYLDAITWCISTNF